jgi:hypothetical protein
MRLLERRRVLDLTEVVTPNRPLERTARKRHLRVPPALRGLAAAQRER